MASAADEQLPCLLEDITPEWLGARLGYKITSIENTHNIWGTGSKLFFIVTYKDGSSDDRPTHVCVKGAFNPAMIKAQPWTVTLAQREAMFFTNLAPSLKNMIFPKGWWGGRNDQQGIVIMSDLAKEGCTFPSEAASCSVKMVMNGVEQLAGLHAQYWGQNPEDYPWIVNDYDGAMKSMCTPWHDVVREPGRPQLPEYLMDGKRCNEALDRYYAERNPRFRTLLHGDTHIGNIYFTADGRIGFLDWSAYHFASCFHDIVYLMTTMLSIEDRRTHEMGILDHYLNTLHRLGGPKFDRYNDPEVMIEYRRSFMTNVIWVICPEGLQTKERVHALCERTVATWNDHKVMDVILDQPMPTI